MNKSLKFLSVSIVPWALQLFLLLFPGGLKSQGDPRKDYIISAQGHAGYIISHRNNMAHLIKGHVFGGELNYVFRTTGNQSWQKYYKYPELGFCAMHMDLANPEQLGSMEALYPYTNIRLNKLKRSWKLNLRLGVGLAFVTRPFHRRSNYKNNAIGSHLNGFVNLRLGYAFMLSKSWRLDAGVGLTHASNGAIATPNLGLNIATVSLGLGYAFGNKDLVFKKDSMEKFRNGWVPAFIGVIGIREMEQPDGPKYLAFGLMANVYRTLGRKNRLGLGAELGYNNATREIYENDSIYNTSFKDIGTVGTKLCYEFVYNRISLPVEFGYYLHKKQPAFGSMFHRIGIRYMMTKHVMANITLLTHWARADYFEWGIGYVL
ncbi:MAG TPA: acyloxyacyl hydrolase [Bacteroidia bacterium]|jgi:hypothetical protein